MGRRVAHRLRAHRLATGHAWYRYRLVPAAAEQPDSDFHIPQFLPFTYLTYLADMFVSLDAFLVVDGVLAASIIFNTIDLASGVSSKLSSGKVSELFSKL
jgi:hypothetical protein